MSFEDKVVLVTGGASGMGRLAAQRMVKLGAKVAAVDVNESGLAETARDHAGIRTFTLDVTDTRAVEDLARKVEGSIGPIDRVYNAAAIMPTSLLMEQDTRDILRIMDVDYGGVVNVCKATLPGMLERGHGDMILFASIAGWSPTLHFGAYNAAKFAVVAFGEVLYHENRDRGVRFCIVCPPPVDTPLLDQAKSQPKILKEKSLKPIQPDEVLDAIERDLTRGKLFCYPNRQTHMAQLMRRFVPGLVWAGVHRIEGR
ncbi:MAG TPA: SDR family oxidoreductase [Myxococcota bacterium]|nr:SDR family oxidoreductase [Myxococcota bacterium]